jgi:hypothetical protein
MNASIRFLVWGTLPLGSFLGGVLGQTLGVRQALWVGAIGGMFAFIPVFLSPLRGMRDLPTYQEEPATEAEYGQEPVAGMATG